MRPTGLVVLAALLLSGQWLHPSPAFADPYVTANAALVMNAHTGTLLYEKNPRLPLPMASTTKVMTALLGIELLRPTDVVRVSSYAVSMVPSKIHLKPGELISAENLLYAILLGSANDASVALAEKISGSEKSFARAMTVRARELGARSTRFENASGLPAEGHYSTAYDLAILFQYAMRQPEFADIMQRKIRKIGSVNGSRRSLRSHNRLLWTFPGAVGGKTGFTRAAKHCYVGMAERGNRVLIVSALGSSDLWGDTRRLLDYGFDQVNGGETRLVLRNHARLVASTPQPGPKRKPALMAAKASGGYAVQIGAFQDKRRAEALLRTLRSRGYRAYVTSAGARKGGWHRVRVGEFETRAQANAIVGQLHSRLGLRGHIAAVD